MQCSSCRADFLWRTEYNNASLVQRGDARTQSSLPTSCCRQVLKFLGQVPLNHPIRGCSDRSSNPTAAGNTDDEHQLELPFRMESAWILF